MTSVNFCTLNDAFPGWGPSEQKNDEKFKRSMESNYFPEDVRSIGKDEEKPQGRAQTLEEVQKQNITEGKQMQQFYEKQEIEQQKSIANKKLQRLPDLDTFKSAEMCAARNNVFQNDVANSYLRTNVSPLNTQGQPLLVNNWPYNNNVYNGFNGQPQGRAGHYNYPYNNNLMYPNNILPIYQQPNLWPPQLWAMDEYGPRPHENSDPYNKIFNYLGLSTTENFGNFGNEYNGYGNPRDKRDTKELVVKMLRILMIILFFLFIVQLVDIVLCIG